MTSHTPDDRLLTLLIGHSLTADMANFIYDGPLKDDFVGYTPQQRLQIAPQQYDFNSEASVRSINTDRILLVPLIVNLASRTESTFPRMYD